MELDPDPKWAKILVPDPKSMYLDPQRCSCCKYEEKRCTFPSVSGGDWRVNFVKIKFIVPS